MRDGSNSPTKSRKILTITTTAILALALGATVLVNGCGGKAGTNSAAVTKAEAEKAKKEGLDAYKQGKWDAALAKLQTAVQGNPKDTNARFQLAYTYEQKGNLDGAMGQYQAILKSDKGSADAHYSIGRIYVQKKEVDKAIDEFETAAQMNSNFTSVRADLAVAYTEKKDYKKALATYDELAKILKNDTFYRSRIHTSKGKIYQAMNDTAQAKVEFQEALKLDKNNKEAASLLK